MVRLSRLREAHDTISAEVELRNLDLSADALHIARLNLFSTQGKSALARHLATQIDTLEWNSVVETVAQATIREYRKGEPVIEIGSLPIRAGPRWRLEGIIPEGDIALLFGPGGSGKSFFALACGVAVSHGWRGLGLEAEPGAVLYLDWEWGWQEHNDRLLALEAGMELDFTPKLFYRYCAHKIENEIEAIQQIIADRGIKLVIIDSLTPALGGAREARENAEPLFTALRSLPGISALIISHTAKDTESKIKTPYGDVFSTNRPRHVLEMRAVSETEGETDIALYKSKSNLPPARLRGLYPLGFRLSTDELGTRLEKFDVTSVPELAERMTANSRILLALKSGPASFKALIEELSLKPASLTTALNRLKHKKFILQLQNKDWALRALDDF